MGGGSWTHHLAVYREHEDMARVVSVRLMECCDRCGPGVFAIEQLVGPRLWILEVEVCGIHPSGI